MSSENVLKFGQIQLRLYRGPASESRSWKGERERREREARERERERQEAPLALDTPRRPPYTGLYIGGEIKSPNQGVGRASVLPRHRPPAES